MTLKISTGLAPEWVTFPDGEAPPRFFIRPLSALELLDVKNEIYQAPDEGMVVTSRGMRTLLTGLLKWERVVDPDGADLPCSETNRERLPLPVIEWLGIQIWMRSSLQESERKNS
jgi:hypothetical protein